MAYKVLGIRHFASSNKDIRSKARAGLIVERGSADEVILNPQADYTKRLLGDLPKLYEPWDFASDKG